MESKVFGLIAKEQHRQDATIELIASENFVSENIMRAVGSCLTNKYSEGYPATHRSGNRGRYYGGCQYVDELEEYCCEMWQKVFQTDYHVTKLKIRAEEIEKEIATLIDKIVSASTATMEYINERIDALDEEKKTVKEKIAQMSAEMYDRQNIGVISDYMSKWNDISIDDKLTVVDTLIESIHVGHGKVKIAWKI